MDVYCCLDNNQDFREENYFNITRLTRQYGYMQMEPLAQTYTSLMFFEIIFIHVISSYTLHITPPKSGNENRSYAIQFAVELNEGDFSYHSNDICLYNIPK